MDLFQACFGIQAAAPAAELGVTSGDGPNQPAFLRDHSMEAPYR